MKRLLPGVLVLVMAALTGSAYAQSCPTAAPTPFYPANNATSVPRDPSNSVTVKWTPATSPASNGTVNYDIYFGPQGSGCTNLHGSEPFGTNQWSPPAAEIFDGATYEWKVVAKGVNGCPTQPSSSCNKFTMNICPTAAPTLTSPPNNSTVAPGATTLTWNAVANAGFYEVYVSIDGAPASIVATTTATSRTITTSPGHQVSWAVRAAKSGCPNGFTSTINSFTTSCPNTAATLGTPVGGATFDDKSSITFSWGSVDGASNYVLYRSADGGQTWTSFADNLTGRTFTTTFPIGNWMWRVRANFGGTCPPIDSSSRGFTVISSSCSNTPPSLLSPPDGSSQTLPVTFTWGSPTTTAGKTFLIFVSGPNGTSQLGTSTTNSLVVSTLAPGTYEWYVVEKNPNCPDVTSAKRTITINKRECLNETINITAPANGATVQSPVTISWSAIQNATAYRIWASQSNAATTLLAKVTTTSVTVNVPAGTVKFKIEGLRDDCPSILSAESSFTVPTATDCGNNTAPQLGTPTPKTDSTTGRKSVILPWIAQTRGILYRVFVALDGQPFENAGDTRDATQVEVSLDPGNYRWYVEELFANCPSLKSAVGSFTVEETVPRCPTDKPVLAEPVNGSTVTKLRFRVTEIATTGRQVKYRFFAVIDRTNAEDEVVFLGSSTEPEFEPTLGLPPGTYQVFVERSVDQCPSTFSDRVTVTIARAQNCNTTPVTLVAPANGAEHVAPEVDFRWNALQQAGATYVLVVQVNDGSPTPVGQTTDTHLVRRVPPGRIRWSVLALYQGCDATVSQPFTFSVDLPQACALPPPVGLSPNGVEEDSDLGVVFAWTAVPTATNYHVWAWKDGDEPAVVATTQATKTRVQLDAGAYNWYVVADIPNCGSLQSATGEFTIAEAPACGTPDKPRAHVVARALSNTAYVVRWTSLAHVKTYELQRSTTADFANATSFLIADNEFSDKQTVATGIAQFFYRVRGLSDCNDTSGPYSEYVTITIVAPNTNNASVEIGGSDAVAQTLFIPGGAQPSTFSITFDKPWIHATPSSGPLPTTGATVTLTSDRNALRIGGNTASVRVAVGDVNGSKKLQSNATTTVTIPINVSLVTPVTPSGKSGPSPDSLIFAAVGHAPGQNGSFFESDVRVANLSATPMKYQINYTPSGTDGTTTGSTTTVEIAPNQTLALDDILSTQFGLGDTAGALGMLEVRPLTTATSSSSGLFSTITSTAQQLMTLGSSRTYNFTPTGTFGQFVPATPYVKFLGSGKILSLQQVAQSDALRANFGFVEASGQPVDLTLRVFDTHSLLKGTIPISLMASEHKQIGLLLASNGITDLQDGRVEIEVTNGTGKVTAYVSEVDNLTNDPYAVSATEKGAVNTNRYVVPGVAHKDLGFAYWVSDVRVFNSGTTAVPATITFYAEANPGSNVSKQVTIGSGEIAVLNDIVQNLFALPNGSGGSIVITTPTNAPLDVSARTYNKTTNGTYGQFVPGVTVADSIGVGSRALQILQVEHSTRFRTYIVLNETSGNSARVEVSLIQPDSIVTPVLTYDLAANEYRQFSAGDFGLGDAIYNGRVTVKVISGSGKVTASASEIDMSTNDASYIPGQ